LEGVSDLTMAIAFQSLSLDNLTMMFNALLLEKPVVIVSEDLCVGSCIVLASLNIIQPLSWQGVFMPVLPRTFHSLLHAPVPLLASVANVPQDEDIDGLIFDLDRKKIVFSNVDKLPTLPEKSKL